MNAEAIIPDWPTVIAEERAAIKKEAEERENERRQRQEQTEERNRKRNMIFKQSLSGVQGVLTDILKEKEVREWLDGTFHKLPNWFVVLYEGSMTNGRAAICLVRVKGPEAFTIEILDATHGARTNGWTLRSEVFYTLPDEFLLELEKLVHADQLVRRIVRGLYQYL